MISDDILKYDEAFQGTVDDLAWSAKHLPIRYLGDEALHTKCSEVKQSEFGGEELRRIVNNLTEVLLAYRKKHGTGRGFAANQIGYTKRVVILWVNDGPITFINPLMIKQKGTASYWESCLSSGVLIGEVHRAWLCTFAYKDEQGKDHELEADAIQTRVLLHELDHLDGISCTSRYQPETMRLLRKGKEEILGSPLKVLRER